MAAVSAISKPSRDIQHDFCTRVADGIYWVDDHFVNWYIIQDGNDLTIVDAGVPASWRTFERALTRLGRNKQDVRALVLTHGHFDHIGFAERMRATLGIPVWAHADEKRLIEHPMRYQCESSALRYLWRPQVARIFSSYARRGAFFPRLIREVRTFHDDQRLDVPGSPRVVATPGHTAGHAALHLADRGCVIAGDALVTLNPFTGGTGPQLIARAATADSRQAMASLDRIADTGAALVLTGHGQPWREGAAEAVRRAKEVGYT